MVAWSPVVVIATSRVAGNKNRTHFRKLDCHSWRMQFKIGDGRCCLWAAVCKCTRRFVGAIQQSSKAVSSYCVGSQIHQQCEIEERRTYLWADHRERIPSRGDWLDKRHASTTFRRWNWLLQNGKAVGLLGLRPFLDFDGVLRCSGRLENATLSFDHTHPIALSSGSAVTKLIICSAHKVTLHGGVQATIQYVRCKFWAPKLRALTRSIIHSCVKCTRYSGAPMTQINIWTQVGIFLLRFEEKWETPENIVHCMMWKWENCN